MDLLALLLGLALGLVSGAAAVWLVTSRRTADAERSAAVALATNTALEASLAEARTRAERIAVESAQRERGDGRILTALAPVQRQLESMQRSVTAIEAERREQAGELGEQLRAQHEEGLRLRAAANALGAALQSSQSRGSWGESSLRNLVEHAGLLERVDIDYQRAVTGETGARRPDAIVRLPGDKHLVIDAKAPLSRFLAASELSEHGDEEERARRAKLLAEHAGAVRGHAVALAKRDYPSAVAGSPELVIAYLPSEAALAAAVSADPALLDDAFELGVALTSPVSLWATLRSIAHAWRQDELTGTAREMFDVSRTLYSRLATTAGHFDKLGRSLTTTVGHYNALIGSIETRVFPAARRLGELDARTPLATLPTVDGTARSLSAPELTDALALAYPADTTREGRTDTARPSETDDASGAA